MAIGRSRSNTCLESQVATQPLKLLPSKADTPESPDYICRFPTVPPSGEDTDCAAIQAFAKEPDLSGLNLPNLGHRIEKYDFSSQENEFNATFELPAGSRQTQNMSGPQTTPKAGGGRELSSWSPTDRKTPPRDPTYSSTNDFYDNGSEVDGDVQARQLRPRERIVFLRRKVLNMRHLRRRRRDGLSRLREDVRDTLDELTRKINGLFALGKLPENFEPLYEKLRIAQDKLGPAEDEYDNFERRLDWEEADLEQQEDHFYRHSDLQSVPTPESKVQAMVSPLLEPSQAPEIQDRSPRLESDLVQDYLAKVEEANSLNEDLDEMENDYYQYAENVSFRKRFNIPPSEEATTFLNDYPKSRTNLLASLHDVEQKIFELRAECLTQGLFADSENVYVPYDALYEDVMDLLEDVQDRSPLRVAARRFRYPEHPKEFRNKREYVNIWMLHWVQESPVDLLMLKDMVYWAYPDVSHKAKDLDNDGWSELVVENWDKDAMGAKTSEFYKASRLDAIAGDTNRPTDTSSRQVGHSGLSSGLRSLEVDLDDAGIVEEVIMGSETGSYKTQIPETKVEASPENLIIPRSIQNSHSWPMSPTSADTPPAGTKTPEMHSTNGFPIGSAIIPTTPPTRKRRST